MIRLCNRTKRRLPPKLRAQISAIAGTIERTERLILPSELSFLIVGRAEMRRFNRQYLGKEYDTDVLTFDTGDIVISLDMAVESAAELGHSTAHELLFLAAHALLHLAGWDDNTKRKKILMHRRTEEILQASGFTGGCP